VDNKSVSGLILAGGEGRRMGGADKGLLDWNGRPLVAHAIERLAPQVGTLLVSANRNLDIYRTFGYPVLTDDTAEHLGPLAGLRAGLAACTTPWLVTCPCDCPALPVNLVEQLLVAVTQSGANMAVAAVEGRMQPTFQLCRHDLLPALDAFLASGNRRVGGWCREMGAIEIVFRDANAFKNMNNPTDLYAPDSVRE
jgi:molybdenum cofactor guanylyltransferase